MFIFYKLSICVCQMVENYTSYNAIFSLPLKDTHVKMPNSTAELNMFTVWY